MIVPARRLLGGLRFLLAALAAVTSCSGPPPAAPSVVVVTTPTTVCKGDDYKTSIALDGSMSRPILALVSAPVDGGMTPLMYTWTLSGSPYRIVPGSGSLTTSKLTVEIAGTEPLQVDLSIDNGKGGIADATATVSITLASDGMCPLDHAG